MTVGVFIWLWGLSLAAFVVAVVALDAPSRAQFRKLRRRVKTLEERQP